MHSDLRPSRLLYKLTKWLIDRVIKRVERHDSEESAILTQRVLALESRRFVIWASVALGVVFAVSLLFLVRYRQIPLGVLFLFVCLVLSEITLCDLATRVIPKECCWVLALSGGMFQLIYAGAQGLLAGLEYAIVFCCVMCVSLWFMRKGKTQCVGGGDIRLLFAFCVACGKVSPYAVMLGIGGAALYSAVGVARGSLTMKDTFAYAPFISSGIGMLVLV